MEPFNFSVQVNVTLGVSKELGAILSTLSNLSPLRLRPVDQKPAELAQETAPVAQKPAELAQETAPVAQKPAETEQKQAEPEQVAAPQEKKDYTTEDVRAAMDRARQRVEGENYKNEKTEGRTKWHAVLTERFKDYAGWIVRKEGQEKPSQLPDSESRAQFIAMADSIRLSDDGEKLIDDDLPF